MALSLLRINNVKVQRLNIQRFKGSGVRASGRWLLVAVLCFLDSVVCLLTPETGLISH